MSKNKGYMLVKYSRYTLPNENGTERFKAPGRRIHLRPDSKSCNEILKQYYNEIKGNPAFTILSKDLRSGWFIYKTNGAIMMIAKMPYSPLRIADVDL